MNIKFDHLSLSAKNPERMRDFFIDLLGLKVGSRPNLSFDGYFLFAGDKDVIHIFLQQPRIRAENPVTINSTEQNIVHHVSFSTDNYETVMQNITKLELQYSINTIPDSSTIQIFVRAPENLILEIQAVREK